MSAEAAMVARLAAVLGVTDLVGSRIYPLAITQETELPAITYRQVGGGPLMALDGPIGTCNPIFAVHAWDKKYADARTLAAAIKTALNGYRGTSAGVVVQGILLTPDVNDEFSQPIDASELGIPAVTQLFTVWHNE